MVRIIAKNVTKLLAQRFKGYIHVSVVNVDTLVIDIRNGRFQFHTCIDSVYILMYNGMSSNDIADIVSAEYRFRINELFFK